MADNIDDVERVYSHAQSLGQCRSWLGNNLPGRTLEAVDSNAKAAMMAADDRRSAAIASSAAGDLYGLATLAANIEDQPDNTTRFLVIGTNSIPPSGDDKTSIVVSTRNETGALYHLLEQYSEALTYHALVKDARGAGMVVPIWCKDIHLMSGATLGGGSRTGGDIQGEDGESIELSVIAARVAAMAQDRGFPGLVIAAMMLEQETVSAWRVGDEVADEPTVLAALEA